MRIRTKTKQSLIKIFKCFPIKKRKIEKYDENVYKKRKHIMYNNFVYMHVIWKMENVF